MNPCPEAVDYLYGCHYGNTRSLRASDCRDLLRPCTDLPIPKDARPVDANSWSKHRRVSSAILSLAFFEPSQVSHLASLCAVPRPAVAPDACAWICRVFPSSEKNMAARTDLDDCRIARRPGRLQQPSGSVPQQSRRVPGRSAAKKRTSPQDLQASTCVLGQTSQHSADMPSAPNDHQHLSRPDDFAQAIKLDPKTWKLSGLGNVYVSMKDYSRALRASGRPRWSPPGKHLVRTWHVPVA